MALVGIRVLVEFNTGIRGSFPCAIFTGDKIDDDLIKTYLHNVRKDIDYDSDVEEVEHDMVFYADEVKTLYFVIVDYENEEPYFEVLDPYVFWPYKESKAHAIKRAKYRE